MNFYFRQHTSIVGFLHFKRNLIMKQTFTTLLLLTVFVAFSQKQPPGLIYSCAKKDNGITKYDIFNSAGQKIINQSVDWAYSNTWTWLFVMDNKTKLKTVYNYYGQVLGIDSIEESQSTYLNLNRIGLKRKGKWGFYDKQGTLRVAHLFDEISHYKKNIAAVKQGKEIYLIDTNGVKVAAAYDPSNHDYSFSDDDIAIGMGGDFFYKDYKKIIENGKVGLLDVVNNKIIIPVEYDKLVDLKDKFKIITGGKNGKYGLIAFDGQIIIPVEYESIFVLNDYF
jgi:WG containing repeat